MLHAAGLVHEQSRSDRDKYIRLIKENLGGNIYNSNFDKDDTLDQNPYDYESIMQYGLRVRIIYHGTHLGIKTSYVYIMSL